jgi:hypothetical protein
MEALGAVKKGHYKETIFAKLKDGFEVLPGMSGAIVLCCAVLCCVVGLILCTVAIDIPRLAHVITVKPQVQNWQ